MVDYCRLLIDNKKLYESSMILVKQRRRSRMVGEFAVGMVGSLRSLKLDGGTGVN